jgi:hypothetical protein
MNADDRQETQDIAELEVRRYFDQYLRTVFPAQVKAMKHHTHLNIEAHDRNPEAHGGVERKFSRTVWLLMGAVAVGGGSASALITKLLAGLV